MPPSRDNIIEICTTLAEQENLKVTIQESGKAALIAGSGALFGGLLAGPIGIAIGGSLASIGAAWRGQGKFKSVAEIIREDMTPQQRVKLQDAITKALRDVDIQDIALLSTAILSNASMKELLLKELGNFVSNELRMNVVQ